MRRKSNVSASSKNSAAIRKIKRSSVREKRKSAFFGRNKRSSWNESGLRLRKLSMSRISKSDKRPSCVRQKIVLNVSALSESSSIKKEKS